MVSTESFFIILYVRLPEAAVPSKSVVGHLKDTLPVREPSVNDVCRSVMASGALS